MDKPIFEPIITKKKTTTLNDKEVSISGINDFDRKPSKSTLPEHNTTSKKVKKIIEIDARKKATKTQKMSPDVILKLETLKPYLKEQEELGFEGKVTVNDLVNLLIDNYLNTKLTTRQHEGYKAMYENLYKML